MDYVVSKKVSFCDFPTIHFVSDDSSCRYGRFWVLDSERFRQRCIDLPKLPSFCAETESTKMKFIVAVRKGVLYLNNIKHRMNHVEFYRLLFQTVLDSHRFETLKANVLKYRKLLGAVIDSQIHAIHGLNNLIVSKGFLRQYSPGIFYLLYLEDIFDEDHILEFYSENSYDSENSAYMHRFGKCLVYPLIACFTSREESDE